MKSLLLSLTVLLSMSSFAETDLKIKISSDRKLSASGTGIFQATVNSFFCKELSANDGSPRMVLKRQYLIFNNQNGEVVIPKSIASKCGFKRVGGGSLSFEVKGKAVAYNTIRVIEGEGDSKLQVVNCNTIISGPSHNQKMINCIGDIRTTDSGEANVEVTLN